MMDEFKDELRRTGIDLWEIIKYSGGLALIMTAVFSPVIAMNAIDHHYATKRSFSKSTSQRKSNTSKKKKYYYTDTDDILSRKDRRDLGLDK